MHLSSTVDDEPTPGPSNPVLEIAIEVAGSCSSFLARLNGARHPTGRTAEARRPMAARREGWLPRQNWVSVNTSGAFPASQYFLPGLAPDLLDLCLQICCCYLAILSPNCCCPPSIKAHSFPFPACTDETGLCLDILTHRHPAYLARVNTHITTRRRPAPTEKRDKITIPERRQDDPERPTGST